MGVAAAGSSELSVEDEKGGLPGAKQAGKRRGPAMARDETRRRFSVGRLVSPIPETEVEFDRFIRPDFAHAITSTGMVHGHQLRKMP